MSTSSRTIIGHCCARPSIANMDHVMGFGSDARQMVNRVCIRCWRHWAGEVGAVREYTKQEWDAKIAKAYSEI